MSCSVAVLPSNLTPTRAYSTPLSPYDAFAASRIHYDSYNTLLRPQPRVLQPQNNVITLPSWSSTYSPPVNNASSSHRWWVSSTCQTSSNTCGFDAGHIYYKSNNGSSGKKFHKRSYSADLQKSNVESSSRKPRLNIIPRTRPNSPTSPSSSSSSAGSSPSSSPLSLPRVLAPVHEDYKGLSRTDSGLIQIPESHDFQRGEIVMTRTTRRLMKTSAAGRLTARHPCLVLETTPSHVRVLQMTSHVPLTEEQVRVVGAQLRHWLAREDTTHTDPFGRPGLVTSPPSDRAGYIWVGDEGEWVPKEQVKYLTGTKVEEAEIQRLESIIEDHVINHPFIGRSPQA